MNCRWSFIGLFISRLCCLFCLEYFFFPDNNIIIIAFITFMKSTVDWIIQLWKCYFKLIGCFCFFLAFVVAHLPFCFRCYFVIVGASREKHFNFCNPQTLAQKCYADLNTLEKLEAHHYSIESRKYAFNCLQYWNRIVICSSKCWGQLYYNTKLNEFYYPIFVNILYACLITMNTKSTNKPNIGRSTDIFFYVG